MSTTQLDYRNRNTLWCSVMVETLVRRGLTCAVTSPGSRCTALTTAFARHSEVESIPVLDERSAAFFALGIAKRQRRPVALVCTSGTAAANYMPAIVEAKESGVPLIVLTADRPPEMRACSSGQTIDQQKLYGDFVTFYHEFAIPEPDIALLRYLRQTVARAYDRSLFPVSGPVHLNCPFRDPLHPAPEEGIESLREGLEAESFWRHLLEAKTPEIRLGSWPLPLVERGIIIAGPCVSPTDEYVKEVCAVARRLGWPILADALSPLRHHASSAPALVAHYDSLLRSPALAQRLKPEAVLILEGLPTSRILRGWLDGMAGVPMLLLSESAENRDAQHGSTLQTHGSLESVAALLGDMDAPRTAYASDWVSADCAAHVFFGQVLTSMDEPFELKAAWLLSRNLPERTPVIVASSMPVRDIEEVWEAQSRGYEVYANRGANGIDGTISTAMGIAHRNRPAVLLTGDLSLLHDTNGFLLLSRLCGSLTIVLINNDGGGIFEHLPIAEHEEFFEAYFATPQKAGFSELAHAYGANHKFVRDWDHFIHALHKLPESGVHIMEVRTDRKADAARRKRYFAQAATMAEKALRER
ncbi:MAG: 2-succinyl-5-enolpyruvyl-6-hydroxy-3-cyclohexene-1-carboxylic-acid synthase [Opitutaceae bacterium]